MAGWKTSFLLGWPIFRGELLVSGRVSCTQLYYDMIRGQLIDDFLKERKSPPTGSQVSLLSYLLYPELHAFWPGRCGVTRAFFGSILRQSAKPFGANHLPSQSPKTTEQWSKTGSFVSVPYTEGRSTRWYVLYMLYVRMHACMYACMYAGTYVMYCTVL